MKYAHYGHKSNAVQMQSQATKFDDGSTAYENKPVIVPAYCTIWDVRPLYYYYYYHLFVLKIIRQVVQLFTSVDKSNYKVYRSFNKKSFPLH